MNSTDCGIETKFFKQYWLCLCRQLLEVLVHPTVCKRRIPVVIACNKSDEGAKAHTVEFVRKRLEREM